MGFDTGMQELWSECLKRLKEAPDAALEYGRSGVSFLKSSIGNLPFLAATSADIATGNPERDETHYFLVPEPGQEGGFILAERRRLPEGTGSVNSLPKVRVFHVHDPAAIEVLEQRLAGKIGSERLSEPGGIDRDLVARLESLGEEIDKQSHWVTGGLIVIGGVVAVANPLLGIGIAAHAILPELGAKLAKFGFGTAADVMKRMGDSWRSSVAKRAGAAEVKRMKAELVIDPVLVHLDRMVACELKDDPYLAELDGLPEWWRSRDQRLSMDVVSRAWSEGPWAGWAGDVRRRLGAIGG